MKWMTEQGEVRYLSVHSIPAWGDGSQCDPSDLIACLRANPDVAAKVWKALTESQGIKDTLTARVEQAERERDAARADAKAEDARYRSVIGAQCDTIDALRTTLTGIAAAFKIPEDYPDLVGMARETITQLTGLSSGASDCLTEIVRLRSKLADAERERDEARTLVQRSAALLDFANAVTARVEQAERERDEARTLVQHYEDDWNALGATVAEVCGVDANDMCHVVDAAQNTLKRLRKERDEARAERDAARDCGQDGVCATPPGCRRHWEERNRELVRERDEAVERCEVLECSLDEQRRGGKYYVKARVYGAIACEFSKALQAFADRGEALAKCALEWRYSESNGVPMSAVKATGELLDALTDRDSLRAKLARYEAVRPCVLAFALVMETKLRENDFKGGWDGMTPLELSRRLGEEHYELTVAIRDWNGQTIRTVYEATTQRVRDEAADVANFAMMIADNVNALRALDEVACDACETMHAPPVCVEAQESDDSPVGVAATTEAMAQAGSRSSKILAGSGAAQATPSDVTQDSAGQVTPPEPAGSSRVLIHDDDCGAALDADGMCPVCKFHPDMQSTAFVMCASNGDSQKGGGADAGGHLRTPSPAPVASPAELAVTRAELLAALRRAATRLRGYTARTAFIVLGQELGDGEKLEVER